jgi:hypothetical protein
MCSHQGGYLFIREGKSPDDKQNSAFLLIFLQISTIFASFSQAHTGTLQNHAKQHSGIIYYISQQSPVTHQLVL